MRISEEVRYRALQDEIGRMNTALSSGKLAFFEEREAYIHPETGLEVARINTWYLTRAKIINHGLLCVWLRLKPEPTTESNLDRWFLENGERWASMMGQVEEERHSLFQKIPTVKE